MCTPPPKLPATADTCRIADLEGQFINPHSMKSAIGAFGSFKVPWPGRVPTMRLY